MNSIYYKVFHINHYRLDHVKSGKQKNIFIIYILTWRHRKKRDAGFLSPHSSLHSRIQWKLAHWYRERWAMNYTGSGTWGRTEGSWRPAKTPNSIVPCLLHRFWSRTLIWSECWMKHDLFHLGPSTVEWNQDKLGFHKTYVCFEGLMLSFGIPGVLR